MATYYHCNIITILLFCHDLFDSFLGKMTNPAWNPKLGILPHSKWHMM